jgi:hypothetical protein
MAHRMPSNLPDMLLWVQFRRGYRKIERLDLRMSLQELGHYNAFMPTGAVPKEHNMLSGKSSQDLFQMLYRSWPIHFWCAQDNFFAGLQIERPIKANLGALCIRANLRSLAAGSPDSLGRCLEVERCLVFGEIDRFSRFLSSIDYFFSTCSSKSATLS